MGRARFLWLLLPLAGLFELGAFVHDARRAPRVEEWEALRAPLAALKRPGDLVLAAPDWADPLLRHALGDSILPIADAARADDTGYRRALEIDALGETAPEVAAWPISEVRASGRFRIRIRTNPAPANITYSFLEHATPEFLSAATLNGSNRQACTYTDHAQVTAGGLHGHLAFPRERFACRGGEEYFVGVTILDDQEYRPRRCLWAHPPSSGVLSLHFSNVPIARKIYGYAGLSYFLFRDGGRPPVTLSAKVGGVEVGRYEHHDETGWHGFEFDTSSAAGQTADVDFEIQAAPGDRQFCFYADTR